MPHLPKHYFGDIPAEVMREIMDEMEVLKPEPDVDQMLEALDRFNRSTVARTVTDGPEIHKGHKVKQGLRVPGVADTL